MTGNHKINLSEGTLWSHLLLRMVLRVGSRLGEVWLGKERLRGTSVQESMSEGDMDRKDGTTL